MKRLNRLYEKVMKEVRSPRIDDIYIKNGKQYRVDEVHSNKVYVYDEKGNLHDIPKSVFVHSYEFGDKESVHKETVLLTRPKVADPYAFFDKPLTYISTLKKEIGAMKKYLMDYKKTGELMFYVEKYKKQLEEHEGVLMMAENIVPILKKLKKGTDVKQVKKLINSSHNWETDKEDYDNNTLYARGPIDLYILFKDDKLTRWYF